MPAKERDVPLYCQKSSELKYSVAAVTAAAAAAASRCNSTMSGGLAHYANLTAPHQELNSLFTSRTERLVRGNVKTESQHSIYDGTCSGGLGGEQRV